LHVHWFSSWFGKQTLFGHSHRHEVLLKNCAGLQTLTSSHTHEQESLSRIFPVGHLAIPHTQAHSSLLKKYDNLQTGWSGHSQLQVSVLKTCLSVHINLFGHWHLHNAELKN